MRNFFFYLVSARSGKWVLTQVRARDYDRALRTLFNRVCYSPRWTRIINSAGEVACEL